MAHRDISREHGKRSLSGAPVHTGGTGGGARRLADVSTVAIATQEPTRTRPHPLDRYHPFRGHRDPRRPSPFPEAYAFGVRLLLSLCLVHLDQNKAGERRANSKIQSEIAHENCQGLSRIECAPNKVANVRNIKADQTEAQH